MGLDELKRQKEARDLFRQRYADGERDFTGIDLRNIHRCGEIFNEINLSKANLQGTSMRSSMLFQANLSGANLERIDLRRTKLKYVNLSGANLRFADLSVANFIHCNLSHADMFCSIHESVRYTYSDLRGVQRGGVNENMSRYVEVNLEGGDLCGGEEPSRYYHVIRDDGEFIPGPTRWLYPLDFDVLFRRRS